MLDQAGSAAEGLAREVVNGYLPIVQVRVRNSVQVLGDQVSHNGKVLAQKRKRGRPPKVRPVEVEAQPAAVPLSA